MINGKLIVNKITAVAYCMISGLSPDRAMKLSGLDSN
jgi:hypothetical protein